MTELRCRIWTPTCLKRCAFEKWAWCLPTWGCLWLTTRLSKSPSAYLIVWCLWEGISDLIMKTLQEMFETEDFDSQLTNSVNLEFLILWIFWAALKKDTKTCGFKLWISVNQYKMVFWFSTRAFGENDKELIVIWKREAGDNATNAHPILTIDVSWLSRSASALVRYFKA
jgi:hypothetical protein